jgi:transcriptional regulator of arginine metabolism
MEMHKRLRQARILKLIAGETIASQDDLRRRLGHMGVRVTQATLSRDIRDLKVAKTAEGYRPPPAGGEEATMGRSLASTLREFLLEMRPAQNLLVLRTPPGGAQALCAALDAENWKEVAGSVAGDNTILLITASRKACTSIQKRIQEQLS